MNKINVAQLLKDCPQGMELDCAMLDDVVFEKISFGVPNHPIVLKRLKTNTTIYLTKYGQYSDAEDYKCVIFPKGKTTWEGFVPPCEFKDGDIITSKFNDICIFKGENVCKGTVDYYCGISPQIKNKQCFDFLIKNIEKIPNSHFGLITEYRVSTEEEKQKLFQAIKDNGYMWNAETKTLEKLIEPKFKVGDRIQNKSGKQITITKIHQDCYECDDRYALTFENQDNWELVPNKFDISTLVPFESRVLVRNCKDQYWIPAYWGHKAKHGYVTTFGYSNYCIPYEGNEHLLMTKDDCSELYKTE